MVSTFAAFLVALCCGGLYGFTTAITSGIILESPWKKLNDFALGIMSAAVLIGAALGCFFGGFIADSIGPKKTLFISALICFLCAGGLCAQKHIVALVILRGISGLGLGCVSAVGPLYTGEQSPAKYRGMLVALYQLCITLGIVLAYGINFLFSSTVKDGKDGWRWEFLLTGVFPLILMISMCFLPESVGYVQKKEDEKKEKERKKTLEMRGEISKEEKNGLVHSLKEIVKAALSSKRAFVVGLVLAIFAQATGINAIMMFSPSIIESAGIKDPKMQLLGSVFVGLWNVVTTIIAVFLVDRLGRRPLLLAGFSLMGLGNLLVTFSGFLGKVLGAARYVLNFIGLGFFILGFEVGPGPCFYVIVSELYQYEVRGRAMGIMVTVNWIFNILIVQFYLPAVNALGPGWVFLFLTILCIIVLIFTFFVVPETKGIEISTRSTRNSNGERDSSVKNERESNEQENGFSTSAQDDKRISGDIF